jgi:hypothetical protein
MDGMGNCLRQPGQFHHDTKCSSIYLDFAKTHANPNTDDSLNRRAVSVHVKNSCPKEKN